MEWRNFGIVLRDERIHTGPDTLSYAKDTRAMDSWSAWDFDRNIIRLRLHKEPSFDDNLKKVTKLSGKSKGKKIWWTCRTSGMSLAHWAMYEPGVSHGCEGFKDFEPKVVGSLVFLWTRVSDCLWAPLFGSHDFAPWETLPTGTNGNRSARK